MEINLLLPQSAIRLWGINLGENAYVNQLKYISRHSFDVDIEETIYRINSLILNEINLSRNLTFISSKINISDFSEEAIYDCHLLNLNKYYFTTRPKAVNILDYSTLGQRSLLLNDFRYPLEFSRAFKRNITLQRKFSPKSIIHWDDYAFKNKNSLIHFGWENIFCDTEDIVTISKSFLKRNLSEISEISFLNQSNKILFILPHSTDTIQDLYNHLSVLLLNPEFKSVYETADYIFVKQHRTSLHSFPSEITLAGKAIFCFQTKFMKLLPVEILFLGLDNITIASVNSSSIYSNQYKPFYFINKSTNRDQKEFGLMRKRLKINTRSSSQLIYNV